MAKAANTQALSTLDRIYRFSGGLRSAGEVDIERPVAVVHDVSRSAELQRGFFFQDRGFDGTVAASTTDRFFRTRANILALADLRQASISESDVNLFLMRTRLTVDSADSNLSFAQLAVDNGFVNDDPTLIAAWNTTSVTTSTGGALHGTRVDDSQNQNPTVVSTTPNPFPLLLLPGSGLWLLISSTAGGNLTAAAQSVFWVGPKGTAPPPFTP